MQYILNTYMLNTLSLQLFKRRNVATAEEEVEEEVMSDGGFHEAQMNNMEMTSVSDGKLIQCLLKLGRSIVQWPDGNEIPE